MTYGPQGARHVEWPHLVSLVPFAVEAGECARPVTPMSNPRATPYHLRLGLVFFSSYAWFIAKVDRGLEDRLVVGHCFAISVLRCYCFASCVLIYFKKCQEAAMQASCVRHSTNYLY